MGGRVELNAYPKPVNSYVLRNDSKNGIHFTDITSQFAPTLQNIGLVCDALCTNFDNDGWQDFNSDGLFNAILTVFFQIKIKNGTKFLSIPVMI